MLNSPIVLKVRYSYPGRSTNVQSTVQLTYPRAKNTGIDSAGGKSLRQRTYNQNLENSNLILKKLD